jgi:hypothetical protein
MGRLQLEKWRARAVRVSGRERKAAKVVLVQNGTDILATWVARFFSQVGAVAFTSISMG